jgi:hypothetical protein
MSKSVSSKISIFLSVNKQTIDSYFNNNDPAPIYKRQLNHAFEQYIMTSVQAVKRYSVLTYKVTYKSDLDKEYIDPLMYAIKGHFNEVKLLKQAEFEKFKRRAYALLFMSLAIVMTCQGIVPYLLGTAHRFPSGLTNSLDVLCWVLLWHPLDQLIFSWNPYLKDISVVDRLANAEILLVKNED